MNEFKKRCATCPPCFRSGFFTAIASIYWKRKLFSRTSNTFNLFAGENENEAIWARVGSLIDVSRHKEWTNQKMLTKKWRWKELMNRLFRTNQKMNQYPFQSNTFNQKFRLWCCSFVLSGKSRIQTALWDFVVTFCSTFSTFATFSDICSTISYFSNTAMIRALETSDPRSSTSSGSNVEINFLELNSSQLKSRVDAKEVL